MRVDTHQHFWQWSKGWFFRPEPVLSLDYLPEDLEPILKVQGIDKTIVVQTSQTVAETDFLLELAETSGFIGGVVGWLDLESPDFVNELEKYCRNRYFVSVRPMLQALPEDDWILRPRVMESLSLIAQTGLAFDFLTFTRHLPYVLKVLERVPHLRAVMDHLSKPEIKAGSNAAMAGSDARSCAPPKRILQTLRHGDRGGSKELESRAVASLRGSRDGAVRG